MFDDGLDKDMHMVSHQIQMISNSNFLNAQNGQGMQKTIESLGIQSVENLENSLSDTCNAFVMLWFSVLISNIRISASRKVYGWCGPQL